MSAAHALLSGHRRQQRHRDEFPLRNHQIGWPNMEAGAREQEAPHGFEPRSLDSESRVLIVMYDQVMFDL